MPEGLFSGSITIFHGTSVYFESIDLGEASRVEGRNAMDQYGSGFYTAANQQNAQTAVDYAASFAGSDGVVLRAELGEGQFQLLQADSALDVSITSRIQENVRNIANNPETPPEVRLYLNQVAEQIKPGMMGSEAWHLLSSDSGFDVFMQELMNASLPDLEHVEGVLSADKLKLFDEAIELSDLPHMDEAQKAEFRFRVEQLAQSDSELKGYYQSLLGDPEKLFKTESYNSLDGPRYALNALSERAGSFTADGISLDKYATSVLNDSGIDGIYIQSEDTIVWKGSGAHKLPDFQVHHIIGNGPVNRPNELHEGDTVIRAKDADDSPKTGFLGFGGDVSAGVKDAGSGLREVLGKIGTGLKLVGTIITPVALAMAAEDAYAKTSLAEQMAAEGRLSTDGLEQYKLLAASLVGAESDPTFGAASGAAIDSTLREILGREPALMDEDKAALGLDTTTALAKQLLGTSAVDLETQVLLNFVGNIPADNYGDMPPALEALYDLNQGIADAEAALDIELARIPRDNAALAAADQKVYAAEEAFLAEYAQMSVEEFEASIAYMLEAAGVTPEMQAMLENPQTRNPLLLQLAENNSTQALAAIRIAELGEKLKEQAGVYAQSGQQISPAQEGPKQQQDLIARKDPAFLAQGPA